MRNEPASPRCELRVDLPGSREAADRRSGPPLAVEQAVDREVVEASAAAAPLAFDAFVGEPESFRDRATPRVLETRSDLDPVEAELREADVDQRPTGTRDVAASLVLRADPVADLAGDAERPEHETHPAKELGPAPEASPSDTSVVGHDGLEPRPLILDRADALDERHPHCDPLALLFDRLPQRLEVSHPVSTKHYARAQVDRQRAHRARA